jgi:predicted RNA binding protein YcfA (HicA-like mRNA interferase family)
MTQLPSVTFRELIAAVERLGFVKVRQRGSHIRFAHTDGRRTTIPDHGSKDVPKGLLLKIIRHDLELSVDNFLGLLQ